MGDYPFPAFETARGGMVRQICENPPRYIITKVPHGSHLNVGDPMPSWWNIEPANELARKAVEKQSELINA